MSDCCPEFNPDPWDKKRFKWEYKKFVKYKVRSLFYMPLNFGAIMKKFDKQSRKDGIKFIDGLTLSRARNMWSSDLYIMVDSPIMKGNNVVINGDFFSMVFEGSYSNIGKWEKEFYNYAAELNYTIKEIYHWYVYCPKCAKKYKKNYTVMLGKIK